MLLEIWFPQFVYVIGGLGALFCFAMVFAPDVNKTEEHHDEHHGH